MNLKKVYTHHVALEHGIAENMWNYPRGYIPYVTCYDVCQTQREG